MSNAIIDMLTEKCDRLTAENSELKQERRNLNDALTAAMDAAHQRAQERVKMQARRDELLRVAQFLRQHVSCEALGHEPGDRHGWKDACPVTARIDALLDGGTA